MEADWLNTLTQQLHPQMNNIYGLTITVIYFVSTVHHLTKTLPDDWNPYWKTYRDDAIPWSLVEMFKVP